MKFSEVAPGKHALIALLQELQRHLGVDMQGQIDGIIRALTQVDGPLRVSTVEAKESANAKVNSRDRESITDAASSVTRTEAEELTRLTLEILPEPFAWIRIPAGETDIWGEGKEYINSFVMAKYPVTNSQYSVFIQQRGYDNHNWWTHGLWNIRQQQNWTEPRYWRNKDLNGAEQPVVGVSWYEAVAFTRWLNYHIAADSNMSGKISLPTEPQWQRAAQGDDGRTYPWGSIFDSSRTNTKETGIGKTTPVNHYETIGASPYGVVDMSGNVWHWCATPTYVQYKTTYETWYMIRGGSWNSNGSNARLNVRVNDDPLTRNRGYGFIICYSI